MKLYNISKLFKVNFFDFYNVFNDLSKKTIFSAKSLYQKTYLLNF